MQRKSRPDQPISISNGLNIERIAVFPYNVILPNIPYQTEYRFFVFQNADNNKILLKTR